MKTNHLHYSFLAAVGRHRRPLASIPCYFLTKPGYTTTLEHNIVLTTTGRIHAKVNPVSMLLQAYFQEEVDELLSQGMIQRSISQHCSPVVIVKKSDRTYRMMIDYRLLNSVTMFDAESASSVDTELRKFVVANYFSEQDLSVAYNQVPLSTGARPLTVFPSPRCILVL